MYRGYSFELRGAARADEVGYVMRPSAALSEAFKQYIRKRLYMVLERGEQKTEDLRHISRH